MELDRQRRLVAAFIDANREEVAEALRRCRAIDQSLADGTCSTTLILTGSRGSDEVLVLMDSVILVLEIMMTLRLAGRMVIK